MARKLVDLVLLIDELEGKGLQVISVEDSFDTSSPGGRAMLQLIGVFAEFERGQLSLATRERLAALKAQGRKLGRPAIPRKVKAQVVTLAQEHPEKSLAWIVEQLGPIKIGSRRSYLSKSTVRLILQEAKEAA
ncbi:recombinase family protein [Chloroflexota bacterium]